ncbi:MAG: hypothetical protein RMM17_02140 [Acidobacteriota bacterium]|nr:hypothetical protein [Blastocatellia bacterium]MDW8411469.1 hypothetical protein [Acidobacteriota bacterium]
MARYRLKLKKVSLSDVEEDNVQARVLLQGPAAKSYEGVAFRHKRQALEAAVSATLDAISQAITKPVNFDISEVTVKELREGKPFVVVLLKTDYFVHPVGEAIELLGACQVTDSEADAAARATLNATNRTVSTILR